MTVAVLIPDDLHDELRKRASIQHSSVDELAVALMRNALMPPVRDYAILQDGRFACFELPEHAPPLDLDRIQAALND
jgi:hypothetical protein